jgi:predicted transposase YdaD
MLAAEWKLEDALVVERMEGREEGIEEGVTNVAINALSEGMSMDVVQRITGLSKETLRTLQA